MRVIEDSKVGLVANFGLSRFDTFHIFIVVPNRPEHLQVRR